MPRVADPRCQHTPTDEMSPRRQIQFHAGTLHLSDERRERRTPQLEVDVAEPCSASPRVQLDVHAVEIRKLLRGALGQNRRVLIGESGPHVHTGSHFPT